MSTPLIECIPNFSEARRPEVVEQIVKALEAVAGVTVLDRHSDLDHNRTVITFVGTPQAVEEAAYQGISTAAKFINMNEHTGAHPRIGATDVVPFVPLSEATMQDCVEMARRLGKRVGEELKIPVYLYEEAATRPERQNLENIRRGQYEGLKEEIGKNPERDPDFGPKKIGAAGATVIGARQPLIAFNVYLATPEVPIAQKIAKAVRFSNGGFRFVKAMGVLVEGRAQVSMNLTNFRQSSIAHVVEFVRREAARYGVSIHHTELVGLTPQESLVDAAQWYLQLDQFEPDQILESKLFTVQQTKAPAAEQPTEPSFVERLASSSPTPGGGSASAFAASMAAALTAMVGRLTVGKKKYADVERQVWPIIEEADTLCKSFTQDVSADSAAFDSFMKAMKLPKDNDEQASHRSKAIQKASVKAIQVPLSVCRKIPSVARLVLQIAAIGNINAISDAGTAIALGRAALSGAGLNVQINCQNLEDKDAASKFLDELSSLKKEFSALEKEIHKTIQERSGLTID
jgi:glutamate formiminotransferase/formiminotetrahydrofolate cyclodeaminase